jgi:sugar phosphate isomerase/epimerase
MSNIELIGSYWTLASGSLPPGADSSGVPEHCPFDLVDRVEAAAKAGFTGMGFWHSDLQNIVKTRSFSEVKKILDANGIVNVEIEFLLDWFLDGEKKIESDKIKSLLLDAAEVLNANHIKIGDFSNEFCPMDKMIERFSSICAEADDRGTKILFEILPQPFSRINTLDDALALTRGAGAKNGGLMFDIWHNVRNGISNQEIIDKLTPNDLVGAELNDGLLVRPEDMFDATVNKRLLLGEGEFDIEGFIAALKHVGFNGPFGIEVLSSKLRALPLDVAAKTAYETTLAAFK